jgi:hypothetical protein
MSHPREIVSAVLVDSNMLLDVMTEDSRWFSWSAKALASAAETSRLVIYAEVSVRYSRIEELNAAFFAESRMQLDNATNLERKSGERAAPVRRAGFACVVLFDSRTSQNDSARHRICRQQFFRSMPSATTVPFLRRSVAPRRTLIHDEARQWGQSCLREVQEPPKQ